MPELSPGIFQQFFDHGPPAMILQANAPDFIVMAANTPCLVILHCTLDRVKDKSIWQTHPDDPHHFLNNNRAAFKKCFNTVLQSRQTEVLNEIYASPQVGDADPEGLCWQVTVSPVLDEGRLITSLICIFNRHDISSLKNFQQQNITELSDYKKEQLQLQFMRAPVGMVFVNRDNYVIDYANDAMRKLWNKAEGVHILGESVFSVIPELEGQGFRAIFDEVINTGVPFNVIETPMYYNRGEKLKLYHLDLSVEPLYDAAGEISGLVGFALDVTSKVRSRVKLQDIIDEKKIIEATLRNNEERLVQILETMAEGVTIIDTDGMLTYANPMAHQILGLHENELHTRVFDNSRWQTLWPDGSPLPYEEHPMNTMMATGKPLYDQEIAIQPPGGERFYISINAAPIHDQNNAIVAGVGTFTDITSRRRLAEQKDEFISVASHELKTPLTSLKISMQLLTKVLRDDPASLRIPLYLEKANDTLNKVIHLTEDLMNVSKIDHDKLPLKKTWFNLYRLINDCCEHVRNDGIHEVVVTGRENLKVYADIPRLEQVIVNLVNNAVKYAPDATRINISITKDNAYARVTVEDFGMGIPADKVPHLFERYYRVNQANVQFSGLGLGLYICAEIINRHSGEIGVESTEGYGSTFWFTLPLK